MVLQRKTLLKIAQFALAAIILILIVSSINLTQAAQLFLTIDPVFLLLAIGCYALNNVLMGYRLKRILAEMGNKLRFRVVFLSHMAGMLLSDFTPARSGYLYVAYALNRKQVALSEGLVAITSPYLYDLLFKLGTALLAIYFIYVNLFNPALSFSLFVVIGVFLLIIIGYVVLMYPPEFLKRILLKRTLTKKALDIGAQSRSIQHMAPFILGISVTGWILRGLEWFFAALSLHILILSLTNCLFLNSLLTLLSLIPITPAGLGLQEAGIIGVLTFMGISITAATSFALLIRCIEIGFDLIGLRGIYTEKTENASLLEFYNSIDGDVDETAFNSDMLVQRYFQQRKTSEIRDLLHIQKTDVLLDIGCGSGVQIREVVKNSCQLCIGMELNRNALIFAKNKSIPNTEYLLADAQYLPIRETAIDKIICAELIEHLPDPDKLLSEVDRVLKEGGEIVITTPNERSIWGAYELLWDYFGRGRNYTETHLKFYYPKELRGLFKTFSEVRTQTMFFMSPVFALSNSERIHAIGIRFDRFFEKWGWGVSILLYAKK